MKQPLLHRSPCTRASGGAQDVENFRENVKHGYLPLPTDVTFEVGQASHGQCWWAEQCLLASRVKHSAPAQLRTASGPVELLGPVFPLQGIVKDYFFDTSRCVGNGVLPGMHC